MMPKALVPTILFTLMLSAGILLTGCKKESAAENPPSGNNTTLIKGADVSYLPEVRASGLTLYNADSVAQDPLTTLKNAGVNTLRLRLWHTPADPTSSLATVKSLSDEARAMGFKILITLHYSDTWADPSQQTKPAAWSNLHGAVLADSVYQYTLLVSRTIKPDYLQLGNEINGGLLWPNGHYDSMANLRNLLGRAAAAVRLGSPETRIVLHYAGLLYADNFFAQMRSINYDLIGLSYYPKWHGKDLNVLQQTLSNLYRNENKSVLIAETAYPFTLGWNDWTNNVVGQDSDLITAYPATPEGQKNYVTALHQLVKNTAGAAGFCYWGAEWISYKGNNATNASSWENQAFWDFNRKALPVLQAY